MSRIGHIIKEIAFSGSTSGFVSTFGKKRASETELSEFMQVDGGLLEFWRTAESAELFKDKTHGQWGLKILTPEASRSLTQVELIERPGEMLPTDLVFAEFFGDSDQLIMEFAFERADQKPIYVKLPLDRRYDWPKVADSFEEFLEKYSKARGDKFWEI